MCVGKMIASLLDAEESLQQMEDELEAKHSDGNIRMRTRTEYYNLVREHGISKIDL